MKFLGDSEDKIAVEKAGIIKKMIPVVIGETQIKTKDVFIEKAKAENSEIFFADKIFQCERITENDILDYQSFNIYKNNKEYINELKFPLLGNYQNKNRKTIICAIDILKNTFSINENHIKNGLFNVIKNTSLMGRWQIIQKKPLVIADTGHNVAGITEIINQLSKINYSKLHFVLSVVNDKDIDSILQLLPKNAEYYFCKADIPRGLDVNILAEKARSSGLKGNCYNSVNEAYTTACANAKDEDLVFVGGSNFTVAEII